MSSQYYDLLRHASCSFKYTRSARKFSFERKLTIPDTAINALNGWDVDSIYATPTLSLDKTVSPLIRQAKLQVLCQNTTSSFINSLFSLSEDKVLNITQVIIVTETDNGKIVPVMNRFKYDPDADSIPEQLYSDAIIPTDEDLREACGQIIKPLGCYVPKTGIIFLWIDRIFQERQSITGYLIFQKVLLHELIHAWLDCSDRNSNMDVLLDRSSTWQNYEETIDNLLVLKCYEKTDSTYFNSVKSFVKTQPEAYNVAAVWYDISLTRWNNSDYVSRISDLITYKILPHHKKNQNPLMPYLASCYDEDAFEDSLKEIFEEAVDADIVGNVIPVENSMVDNGVIKSVVYTPLNIKSNSLLTRIIISHVNSDVLCKELYCTFHFSSCEKGVGIVSYHLFEEPEEKESEFYDKLINTGVTVDDKTAKLIYKIIELLSPETKYTFLDFINV